MSIPFIRGFPDGTIRPELTCRSAHIEALADRFLTQGGGYFITLRDNGEVSFVTMVAAVRSVSGEVQQVAIETCLDKAAEVQSAVDRLVRKSVEHLGAMH